MRTPDPDIEAEVRFLATEEGGKSQPCRSGYRTTHNFGLDGTLTDALHVFPGVKEVLPGETVTTRMSFLAPQYQEGRLYVGFRFTVQEAKRGRKPTGSSATAGSPGS
ncbi:hypothetical protein [Pelagibius sp.]|uniref:hypothetical protein n=1 Tax=Pelagibius sp. TaxID=1931238 RepID=UPI0026046A2F|nr:hypothetical protein [Pelagibius sp.]